jgi:type IV pilus assembly protein PilV
VSRQETSSPKSAQQGVVLLEALIAILLFSMGVLAVVGLQAAMIKNTADSKFRADASYIAQQRLGLMWSNPDPVALAALLEPAPGADISNLLPAGKLIVTQPAPGQFTVTVTWKQPGGDQSQHNFTTTARITGG